MSYLGYFSISFEKITFYTEILTLKSWIVDCFTRFTREKHHKTTFLVKRSWVKSNSEHALLGLNVFPWSLTLTELTQYVKLNFEKKKWSKFFSTISGLSQKLHFFPNFSKKKFKKISKNFQKKIQKIFKNFFVPKKNSGCSELKRTQITYIWYYRSIFKKFLKIYFLFNFEETFFVS